MRAGVQAVPGLRWTTRGAVALPETVQVRLGPLFAGRVAVGAPEPRRALTADELSDNLRWFTDPGPRGRPVVGLVLSGLTGEIDPLAPAVREARDRSVRSVVAHVDGPDVARVRGSALGPLIDRWVAAVRTPEQVAPGIEAVVPLDPEVLPLVAQIADAARGRVPRLIFTWPYPRGPEHRAPPVEVALEAVRGAISTLGGTPWHLKGIPACVAASLGPQVIASSARSSNRWYVDADHQRERALLFQPDVLTLAKREACRFCDLDPRCDGAAERWLQAGLVPPLVPIRA